MPKMIPTLPRPDVGNQVLEPLPGRCLRPRTAQVLVDDHHLAGRPAQSHGPVGQLVLALQALGVLPHLGQRRLANIHVGVPAQMARRDLRQQVSHRGTSSTTPLDDQAGQQRQHLGLGRCRQESTTVRRSATPSGKTSGSWTGAANLSLRKEAHLPVRWSRAGSGEPICRVRAPAAVRRPARTATTSACKHTEPLPDRTSEPVSTTASPNTLVASAGTVPGVPSGKVTTRNNTAVAPPERHRRSTRPHSGCAAASPAPRRATTPATVAVCRHPRRCRQNLPGHRSRPCRRPAALHASPSNAPTCCSND